MLSIVVCHKVPRGLGLSKGTSRLSSSCTWVSTRKLGLLLSYKLPEGSSALEETGGSRWMPVSHTVCSRNKNPTFSGLIQWATSHVTLCVLGRAVSTYALICTEQSLIAKSKYMFTVAAFFSVFQMQTVARTQRVTIRQML